MNPIRIRAAELAKAIADAMRADPPGTGTMIDIKEGDWEIICLGLGIVACSDDNELEARQ